MKRYIAQKGDICRWSYLKEEYGQEYSGREWSCPIPLQDLASSNPSRHARVMRPTEEPDHYEIVHRKKRHRKTYYREKA